MWDVRVTIGSAKRVLSLTGVDLVQGAADATIFDRLASDPILLVDVLFAIVKPQADVGGVTAEAFAEAFDGSVLDAAAQSLLEAVAGFFPNARGAILRRIVTRNAQAMALVNDSLRQALTNGDVDRVLDQTGLYRSGEPVPNSPDSAGSSLTT